MKIKVYEFDKSNHSIVVATAEDDFTGDMDLLRKGSYTPHSLGIPFDNPIAVLKAIAGMSKHYTEERSNEEKYTKALEKSYEDIVGNNYTFTDTEMFAVLEPDRLARQQSEEAMHDVLESLPSAPSIGIKKVLDTYFEHLKVSPVIRLSNADAVGVTIDFLMKDGAILDSIAELDKFDALCKENGVTSIQYHTNRDDVYGTDHDYNSWTDFIMNRYGMKKVAGIHRHMVYAKPDLMLWARRHNALIKQERDDEVNTPVTVNINSKDFTFDNDEVSRANLSEQLTVLQTGRTLPSGYVWRSSDNKNVPVTKSDLHAIAYAMADAKTAAYANSWTKKQALKVILTDANDDDATKIGKIQGL